MNKLSLPVQAFKASTSSSFRCTYEWRIDQSCRCHTKAGKVLGKLDWYLTHRHSH